MSKDADVDRLTALLKRLETTPDVVRLSSFKPEILGDCTVGDLRQSLSQEAVREEVLEEAARVAELFTEPTILAFYDRPGGPPGNARVAVTGKAHIAPAIRALKREPNAAGQGGPTASHSVAGTDHAGWASPALAAPDVASMVKRLRGCVNDRHDPAVTTYEDIEALALEAAALLAKLGQGWIPVSAEALKLARDLVEWVESHGTVDGHGMTEDELKDFPEMIAVRQNTITVCRELIRLAKPGASDE